MIELTLWVAFLLVLNVGAVLGALIVLAIQEWEAEHDDR